MDGDVPFVVELPAFVGNLHELAQALRSGRVRPHEVPLLDLTRRVLERFGAWRAEQAGSIGEALPALAGVIALKARLLLPQPESEEVPEDDLLEEMIEGTSALAELDALVSFLSLRRQERAGLIAAPPLDLGWPRRARAPAPDGLAKLVRAAKNAVRDVSVPLLARERLTLRDALSALRAYAERLKRFTFGHVPVQGWGERGTYFAALLEGVKTGEFAAHQTEVYGEIEVERLEGRTVTARLDVRYPEQDGAPAPVE